MCGIRAMPRITYVCARSISKWKKISTWNDVCFKPCNKLFKLIFTLNIFYTVIIANEREDNFRVSINQNSTNSHLLQPIWTLASCMRKSWLLGRAGCDIDLTSQSYKRSSNACDDGYTSVWCYTPKHYVKLLWRYSLNFISQWMSSERRHMARDASTISLWYTHN